MSNEKPPLGLKPKSLHDGDRAIDIMAAIKRYIEEGKPIPKEWFDELSSLVETYQ